jgi:hypothetical protein
MRRIQVGAITTGKMLPKRLRNAGVRYIEEGETVTVTPLSKHVREELSSLRESGHKISRSTALIRYPRSRYSSSKKALAKKRSKRE